MPINLAQINTDFRINERIFREKLATRPDLELALSDRLEESKNADAGKKVGSIQPRRADYAKNQGTVVHKFATTDRGDPQAMAKSNYYMAHF